MTAESIAQLPRIAEGREAEIFAWGPGVVLKLYRSQEWRRSRDIERASMEAVRAAGGPAPAALGVIEVKGRPGLLMERINGIDMLTELGKKPWTIVRTGGILGRLQAALHETEAPAALESLKSRLQRQIEGLPDIAAALKARALSALAGLPEGDRLCHGDFHPGNVMLTSDRPIVIDWPNATRGDPAAGVARTSMMIKLGELPPGTPSLIRRLDRVGRRFLLWRYREAYTRARPADAALIDRWTVPVAAGRLSEGIVEEQPRLLKTLGAPDPRTQ